MSTTTNLVITKLDAGVRQPEIIVNDALDILDAALGKWATYTPTWAGLSVGNGTVTARYIKINKTVFVRISVVFGSSTSVSASVTVSLPVTSATYAGAIGSTLGSCRMYDQSVPVVREGAIVRLNTTTGVLLIYDTSGTYLTSLEISGTVPFTWTTSDEMIMQFSYEAA